MPVWWGYERHLLRHSCKYRIYLNRIISMVRLVKQNDDFSISLGMNNMFRKHTRTHLVIYMGLYCIHTYKMRRKFFALSLLSHMHLNMAGEFAWTSLSTTFMSIRNVHLLLHYEVAISHHCFASSHVSSLFSNIIYSNRTTIRYITFYKFFVLEITLDCQS